MLRLAALVAVGFTAALSAQATPCLAVGDNPNFDDRISTGGPNLLIGFRETTGNTSLVVHALEVFTGEGSGTNTLGIWTDDVVNNRPMTNLGTASFAMSSINGWQGENLPAPIMIPANTVFWIVWGPRNGAQSSIEQRNPNNAGTTYRGSFDGGQTWNGPFNFYDWKYRVWCSRIASPRFDVFGTPCPATSRTQPRIGLSALPRQGATVDLTLAYPQPRVAGGPAFAGLGYSDQNWGGGIPLPFDLGPLGAPSCQVLIDLRAVFHATMDGSGNAAYRLIMPTQASTLGLQVYAQWVVPDPQANALGFVTSDGGRITIGS